MSALLDLHVHSHWSDGDRSPWELVAMAKERGLAGLALTDHDTLAGGPELLRAGRAQGLPVYLGVEISCVQANGRQLHLLGYAVPEEGREAVEAFCRPIREGRNQAVLQAARALAREGYPISEQRLLAQAGPQGQLCKQYLMAQLLETGLCQELSGPLYKRLFKTGEGGRPPIAGLSFPVAEPEEAVRRVTEAGGKAVLAHPGQYGNYEELPRLAAAGLWGIEAYHPKHSPENVNRCLELARQYGLAVTGGSDFHGRYGEGEILGEQGVRVSPFAEE